MPSKYKEMLLELLKGDFKSTNEVLKELEAKTKKTINWHHLQRVLTELYNEGKIDRIKSKAAFLWKNK